MYYYETINPTLTFASDNGKDIIDTVEYFAQRGILAKAPPLEKLVQIGKLIIEIKGRDYVPEHTFDVHLEDFGFIINANAFHSLKESVAQYERERIENLYALNSGYSGIFFLPKSAMEGLRDYDWSRHEDQVNKWLKLRNVSMRKGHAETLTSPTFWDSRNN